MRQRRKGNNTAQTTLSLSLSHVSIIIINKRIAKRTMKLFVAPFALLLTGTHGFSVVKPSTSTLLRVATSTSTPSFSVSTIAGTTATAATTAGTQHHRTTGWQLAASASGEEESREAEATSTESADEDEDKEVEEEGEEETSVADEIVVTEEAPDAAVAEATPVVVDFEEPDTVSNNNDEATLIQALFALGSTSGRGEFATPSQRDAAKQLIAKLEEAASTTTPIALDDSTATAMLGKWELVYSNTQLFRSSPFFMAGRAVCTTPEQAQQYDWFCDMHRGALAMSQIGAVRQIISRTRMVSEFEVKAGTIPFLNDFTPFSYSGGWPVSFPCFYVLFLIRSISCVSYPCRLPWYTHQIYNRSQSRAPLSVPLTLLPRATRGKFTWTRSKSRAATCPVCVKSSIAATSY